MTRIYDQMIAVTVTVPDDGEAHQLWTLIKDAATGANANANPPGSVRELTIQNDPDQNNDTGNGSVLIGDSYVSLDNCGFNLKFGQSHTIRASHNEGVSMSQFWVIAVSGPVDVNIIGYRN